MHLHNLEKDATIYKKNATFYEKSDSNSGYKVINKNSHQVISTN